eukprot:m.71015 g.71015  ORF g.71015 m.71015 type:complete len:64 (-) comp8678_c0_seq2:685-876(-)
MSITIECPECRVEITLEADDEFCTECGHELTAAERAAAVAGDVGSCTHCVTVHLVVVSLLSLC